MSMLLLATQFHTSGLLNCKTKIKFVLGDLVCYTVLGNQCNGKDYVKNLGVIMEIMVDFLRNEMLHN